jgi:hypothetical protein
MANWQKKADQELKRVILEVGHCEWCGRSDKEVQLHHHHIIPRGNYAYRHLVENCLCLCASCHTLGAQSAHNDISALYAWLMKDRPGIWRWFTKHTVRTEKVLGNRTVVVYKPIKIEHLGDEAEYYILKEISK